MEKSYWFYMIHDLLLITEYFVRNFVILFVVSLLLYFGKLTIESFISMFTKKKYYD